MQGNAYERMLLSIVLATQLHMGISSWHREIQTMLQPHLHDRYVTASNMLGYHNKRGSIYQSEIYIKAR